MVRKSKPDASDDRATDATTSGERPDLLQGFLHDTDEVAIGVHEIQNTLASAMFSIDVARQSDDIRERERALKTIERAIQRSRSMLIALGNPTQMFAVSNVHFDGGDLVDELVSLLAPRCRANGVVLTSTVSNAPAVVGDPARVLQILTNFVLNALDAVQSLDRRVGGRGRIHLTHDASSDGSPQWTVVDDGIGMAPRVLERIFEPGFTTHPRQEGARKGGHGIGMSLSSMLARAMNGAVHVESEEGIGTKVRLVLPRGSIHSAPVPVGDAPIHDEPASDLPEGLRVLVVDDDQSIRELMVTALSLRGATVYAAANTEAARSQIAQTGFDVALIDETLGTSERGTTLMIELLDRTDDSRVILMTGAPAVDHLPARVSRFLLRKPFSLDEAVHAILRSRDSTK
jgi:CheY-like chemotaxis protein/two-component sensor histidine kinase